MIDGVLLTVYSHHYDARSINLMRTTVSIPDKYYSRIKESHLEEGYQTVNELILDLIRHHFDAGKGNSQAKRQLSVQVESKGKKLKVRPPKDNKVEQANLRMGNKKDLEMCEHGYIKKLCKHEKCRLK